MSRLLVFTFDNPDEGLQVRGALRDLERRRVVALDDALVLVKDAQGQIRRRRDPSRGLILGAIVGGLTGLLWTFMFPVISVLFSACVGALIGWFLIDRRVGDEFVADAERALRPGTSALLILIRSGDVGELGTQLRTFPLHIYQTSLAPDLEARFRQAYGSGQNSPA